MRTIIFGADGQLGQACSAVFPDAISYTYKQVDITDHEEVSKVLMGRKSPLVINAAAYTDSEKAESDTAAAYRTNAIGPGIIAKVTEGVQGSVVHISTDYVFDGKEGSYEEDSLPNPVNIYGLSKLAGEHAIRAFCSRYYIVRTSALFGSNSHFGDNNFVSKRIVQMQKGEEIKMVSDQWTIPTYTEDLAEAINRLVQNGAAYGIYHIVNSGEAITWFDFTKEIANKVGSNGSIVPISTKESGTKINRPKKSILKKDKLNSEGIQMPDWRKSLEKYVKGLID